MANHLALRKTLIGSHGNHHIGAIDRRHGTNIVREHDNNIDASIAEMVDDVADAGNQLFVNRIGSDIGEQFGHIRVRALRGNLRARAH